ncbi:hypothetical protein D3C75_1075870 [compost metagenome]
MQTQNWLKVGVATQGIIQVHRTTARQEEHLLDTQFRQPVHDVVSYTHLVAHLSDPSSPSVRHQFNRFKNASAAQNPAP